jgi:hypothetical protein
VRNRDVEREERKREVRVDEGLRNGERRGEEEGALAVPDAFLFLNLSGLKW